MLICIFLKLNQWRELKNLGLWATKRWLKINSLLTLWKEMNTLFMKRMTMITSSSSRSLKICKKSINKSCLEIEQVCCQKAIKVRFILYWMNSNILNICNQFQLFQTIMMKMMMLLILLINGRKLEIKMYLNNQWKLMYNKGHLHLIKMCSVQKTIKITRMFHQN